MSDPKDHLCEVCKKVPSEMLWIQYGTATWICSPDCLTAFLKGDESPAQGELFDGDPT